MNFTNCIQSVRNNVSQKVASQQQKTLAIF